MLSQLSPPSSSSERTIPRFRPGILRAQYGVRDPQSIRWRRKPGNNDDRQRLEGQGWMEPRFDASCARCLTRRGGTSWRVASNASVRAVRTSSVWAWWPWLMPVSGDAILQRQLVSPVTIASTCWDHRETLFHQTEIPTVLGESLPCHFSTPCWPCCKLPWRCFGSATMQEEEDETPTRPLDKQ